MRCIAVTGCALTQSTTRLYKLPQMLRLEPHMVVSNRTPVPLQLLQTRLALASPPPLVTAASGRGQQPRPQGAVVAEGGHSFSSVASSGFFTSPAWTGGGLAGKLAGRRALAGHSWLHALGQGRTQ